MFQKMIFFNCTVSNFLYTGLVQERRNSSRNDPKRTHEKYETIQNVFDPSPHNFYE